MARKAKKLQITKNGAIQIVNPNAAGVDIADGEMQVCVPPDRCEVNNRRFGSNTRDLRVISAWLKECGITTVAMESTGVYWIPLFNMLEDDGFEVILCNAQAVKNYTDRKTDASDALHLMSLHMNGLLTNCFQPDRHAAQLRKLARYRETKVRDSAKTINRMQKAMEQMNIKLSVVISDITGKSGMRIIEAILKGNHDPKSLAMLADGRCKKSKEEIALALEGTWDEELLFVLEEELSMYRFLCERIAECDFKIQSIMDQYLGTNKNQSDSEFKSAGKSDTSGISFNVEQRAFSLWGVNCFEIPGFNSTCALQLSSELGANFYLDFPSASHFASWCNLVPNTKISGGKKISSRVPHKKNKVGQIFRSIATSAGNTKTELGQYYRRIRSRSGGKGANVATAHRIAIIFYNMVARKESYGPKRVGCNQQEILERQIAIKMRQLSILREQQEQLQKKSV